MDARKKVVLNTWGVMIYFFAQWVLTILVTRISGYEAAGQYSLAVSFANIFSFIGMFGVRALQVSDVSHRYTDGQYYALRIFTCSIAVLGFSVSILFTGYSAATMWCCVAMMIYKLTECAADVAIGSMQRKEQFGWIAVSYTLRAVIPAIAFLICLVMGLPLPVTILAMAGAFAVCFLAYDVPLLVRAEGEKSRFQFKGTLQILRECFPLMLTSLLDSLMVYIPRDAVERALGSEALGYYGTVSIVVVVLSTLGTGVWGSVMPRISILINKSDFAGVKKTVKIIFLCMIVAGAAVLVGGSLLGPLFFKILFGEEILAYMYLLLPVLLNAVLLLFNSFYTCVFVPLNKRNVLLYTNALAVIVCAILSNFLVSYGLMGACIGLTVSLTLRAVLLLVILIRQLRLAEKRG